MLTLWNLFEASLLCLNAVCVLHEERFMQKSKLPDKVTKFYRTLHTIIFIIINNVLVENDRSQFILFNCLPP